jgi:membrane fusion protein (multidrug efflux system)
VGPSTLLTTVSQLDPIKVYFSLSEQEYLAIAGQINQPDPERSLWQSGAGEAHEHSPSALTLILADGSEYPHPGSFLAADRQLDPMTGTLRLSATFPNPSHILRPGQSGRVRAETELLKNALIVPQRALSELQGKPQLRVVGDDNRINIRTVSLGKRVGNRRVITAGLQAGERVVIDASQLAQGTEVLPTVVAPTAHEQAEER